MSDSPWLVDFAIWQVNFILNLPKGQMKFLRKSSEINSAHKNVLGASPNDLWANKS